MMIVFHCAACEMGVLVECVPWKSRYYGYLNLLRILPPLDIKGMGKSRHGKFTSDSQSS